MNERLKELYTQVCMEQKLPFTVEHNSAVMLDAFADKFAELIVQECVAVCWAENGPESGTDAGWYLKEHFGVEG
jgi:hypothetical protein